VPANGKKKRHHYWEREHPASLVVVSMPGTTTRDGQTRRVRPHLSTVDSAVEAAGGGWF
jgi:hypothetical protein